MKVGTSQLCPGLSPPALVSKPSYPTGSTGMMITVIFVKQAHVLRAQMESYLWKYLHKLECCMGREGGPGRLSENIVTLDPLFVWEALSSRK